MRDPVLRTGPPAAAARGLPAAWRAATAFCPHCSGTGNEDERACVHCEGTGDLLGTQLRHAYKLGLREGLSKLGGLRDHVAVAIDQLEDPRIDTAQLKRTVGL